ncbi:hypothetical protein BC828DRAFT_160376 [Blastocladiella britannica]|nr:hypothetical protein BC828DRAFT_160376 [Blastocladiella britannica]
MTRISFTFLLLAVTLGLVNAQGGFQAQNKALAAKLDGQKAGLKIGSPCPADLSGEGQTLCAGNQLARCNGGVVTGPLQSCAATLNCQVLPLVNKPGISVTCDTDADKVARIGAGAGAATGAGAANDGAAAGNGQADKKQGKKQQGKKQQGKKQGGAAAPPTAPPAAGNGNVADFRTLNKQDAARLDAAKAGTQVGDACPAGFAEGSVVCAGDKLAFCLGGKVAQAQSCAASLKCQVLPLVNKRGTSVTCDTDADKEARIRE